MGRALGGEGVGRGGVGVAGEKGLLERRWIEIVVIVGIGTGVGMGERVEAGAGVEKGREKVCRLDSDEGER